MRKAGIAIVLAGALFGGSVSASEMTRINAGQEREVDRFNVCRVVKNDTRAPVMVPHNHANEWSAGASSFLNVMPDGMSVKECVKFSDIITTPPDLSFRKDTDRMRTSVAWGDGSAGALFDGWSPLVLSKRGYIKFRWRGSSTVPFASHYNDETGSCAPAKSVIGIGEYRVYQMEKDLWGVRAPLQVCDIEGRSSPRIPGMKRWGPKGYFVPLPDPPK